MNFYIRSLFSGYGTMAIGVGCSLVTVPMALHFISASQFGIWAIVLQLTGYFALADTGISSSIGRLLIDYRSERPSLKYGSIFGGGLLLLGGVAGVLVLVALLTLPFLAGKQESHTFVLLIALQTLIVAASLPVRAIGQTVLAASRYDLIHACLGLSLLANLLALWIAFICGAGVFAFVIAGAFGLLVSFLGQWLTARAIGSLPSKAEICLPAKGEWKHLFFFARDVVAVQAGNALVFSTQAVIVGYTLGVNAAASWAVGSKLFLLFLQVAGKAAEVAGPPMAEMHLAADHKLLAKTLRRILLLSLTIAGCGAVFLIFGNSLFVTVWTGAKIGWPQEASLFLGIWLVAAVIAATLTSHAIAAKRLSRIRFAYLFEGVFSTVVGWWAASRWGIPGLTAAFCLGCLLFSFRVSVSELIKGDLLGLKHKAS